MLVGVRSAHTFSKHTYLFQEGLPYSRRSNVLMREYRQLKLGVVSFLLYCMEGLETGIISFISGKSFTQPFSHYELRSPMISNAALWSFRAEAINTGIISLPFTIVTRPITCFVHPLQKNGPPLIILGKKCTTTW